MVYFKLQWDEIRAQISDKTEAEKYLHVILTCEESAWIFQNAKT